MQGRAATLSARSSLRALSDSICQTASSSKEEAAEVAGWVAATSESSFRTTCSTSARIAGRARAAVLDSVSSRAATNPSSTAPRSSLAARAGT